MMSQIEKTDLSDLSSNETLPSSGESP
jgi:hypothetical protein